MKVYWLLYCVAAVYEEIIESPTGVKVTYRTYAHQSRTRLLVTDVLVERSSDCAPGTCCDVTADFVIERTDLNFPPNEDDFKWAEPVGYTEPEYCDGIRANCLYAYSRFFTLLSSVRY